MTATLQVLSRKPRAGRRVERVLLVFPPTKHWPHQLKLAMPPLGISYLAAFIRDQVDVRLIDATGEGMEHTRWCEDGLVIYGLPMEEIGRRIAEYQPDVVGISCLFSGSFPLVVEIAQLAKGLDPEVVTIVGGNHATFLAEECLMRYPAIDYICQGEGELVLRQFIETLRSGEDIGQVGGLVYRDRGAIRRNPRVPLVLDLDSLPFPARDLLPMESYWGGHSSHQIHSTSTRYTTLITSRGCTAPCSFCSSTVFWKRKYRERSPENVIAEMQHLKERYGVQEIHFEDDNLTLKRRRAADVFQAMIDHRLDLRWKTPNGIAIWTLDRSLLELMKRSGCYEITLAFESGNQRVMNELVKKPLNLDWARKVVGEARDLGIFMNSFFILGFPGETIAEMYDTINLPIQLDLDWALFFAANPLPGTRLYEVAKEKGYLPPDFDFVNNSFYNSCLNTPDWTADDVNRLTRWASAKFVMFRFLRNPVRFFLKMPVLLRQPKFLLHACVRFARRLFQSFFLGGKAVAHHRATT